MRKKLLLFSAKALVTASLLTLVLRQFDLGEALDRLSELDIAPLAAAVVLLAFQSVAVLTWRWAKVLTAIDRPVPATSLLSAVVVSLFFNQVLPSTVGGDGMRAWHLKRLGHPLGSAIRSVLIDRLIGLLALMLLSAVGALCLLPVVKEPAPLLAAAAVASLGSLAILAAPLMLRLHRWLPGERLRRLVETVAREVAALERKGSLLLRLVMVSLFGHLVVTTATWFLALSMGIELPLLASVAIFATAFLAAAMPVSIAGWGLREGAMVVGLGLIGVAASEAILLSLVFGLLQLAFGLLGGALWLLQGSPRPKAEAIV